MDAGAALLQGFRRCHVRAAAAECRLKPPSLCDDDNRGRLTDLFVQIVSSVQDVDHETGLPFFFFCFFSSSWPVSLQAELGPPYRWLHAL